MSNADDSAEAQQARKDRGEPKPRGKALQVNENSIEDSRPAHTSPPVPRKPREQREEEQQGEAIRVNDNTV